MTTQNDAQSLYESENVQEMKTAPKTDTRERNLADGAASRQVRRRQSKDDVGDNEEGQEELEVQEEEVETQPVEKGTKTVRKKVIGKRIQKEWGKDDDGEGEVEAEVTEEAVNDGSRKNPDEQRAGRKSGDADPDVEEVSEPETQTTNGDKSTTRKIIRRNRKSKQNPDDDRSENEAYYEDENAGTRPQSQLSTVSRTTGTMSTNQLKRGNSDVKVDRSTDRNRGDDVEQGELKKTKSKIPLPKLPNGSRQDLRRDSIE